EDHAGYRQLLQEQILGLIAAGVEANVVDRPGGIFFGPADQISNEERMLLQSVARVIIADSRGTLAEQMSHRAPAEARPPRFTPTRIGRADPARISDAPRLDLLLFNGLGGFTPDGSEYVITTAAGKVTPAPWVNVLANPDFGTVLSESGGAYTWYENAHEFRLTPWHNDPVSDSNGEALFLRDEESGRFWSPTPLPSRGEGAYVSRHGFGYSVFEHQEEGIESELTVYVALDTPVKFSVLKVRNSSGRPRRLSATGYVEWVLGDLRPKSAMHIVTEADPNGGALMARNRYSAEFANQVAFFDADGAAIQLSFELADGQEHEIVFRLGVGHDGESAGHLVRRFRGSAAARETLEAVRRHWKETMGAVQVETPDRALNVLANGWLLYQTISCRLWARSGYYQSGG